MTKEEAIIYLDGMRIVPSENWREFVEERNEVIDLAIEALQADAVSRKDTVTLNSPISIQPALVSVVRCKDCRHRDLFSCPLADNDFQKDEDFCSWGERREE